MLTTFFSESDWSNGDVVAFLRACNPYGPILINELAYIMFNTMRATYSGLDPLQSTCAANGAILPTWFSIGKAGCVTMSSLRRIQDSKDAVRPLL